MLSSAVERGRQRTATFTDSKTCDAERLKPMADTAGRCDTHFDRRRLLHGVVHERNSLREANLGRTADGPHQRTCLGAHLFRVSCSQLSLRLLEEEIGWSSYLRLQHVPDSKTTHCVRPWWPAT